MGESLHESMIMTYLNGCFFSPCMSNFVNKPCGFLDENLNMKLAWFLHSKSLHFLARKLFLVNEMI